MTRLANGGAATAGPGTRSNRQHILVINADGALYDLIEEWLSAAGFKVARDDDSSGGASKSCDLVIVDVPYPKLAGPALLRRVAQAHPATPILALSSAFFPGIVHCGALARSLGVAGALPKPVGQDTLLGAVANLLRQAS